MFKFSFKHKKRSGMTPNWMIIMNDCMIPCIKEICVKLSKTIERYILNFPQSNHYSCTYETHLSDANDIISDIFNGIQIRIDHKNCRFLEAISSQLEIEDLQKEVSDYIKFYGHFENYANISAEFSKLMDLENSFQNLNMNNFDSLILKCRHVSAEIVASFIFNFCIAYPKKIEIYIEFLQKLVPTKIINCFKQKIINEYRSLSDSTPKEVIFISKILFNKNIITEHELGNKFPQIFLNSISIDKIVVGKYEEKVNAHNFNISSHIINCNSGLSSNPIIAALREDNLTALQRTGVGVSINCNDCAYSEYYDRFSCTRKPVPLICIAAFFGAAKCFRFLIPNIKPIPNNLGVYAVQGGNIDIIAHCESLNVDFSDSVIEALKYHHHNIVEWLLECREIHIDDDIFIEKCIQYCTFNSLKLALMMGFNYKYIIHYSARYGNILLLKWSNGLNFLQNFDPFKSKKDDFLPIHYTCKFGWVDCFDYVLNQDQSLINEKGVYFFHFYHVYPFFQKVFMKKLMI